MKWKSVALLVFSSFLLSGCATTPASSQSAAPIPQERILDQSYLKPDAQRSVLVTVIRDNGFMGSGLQVIFKVNTSPIAAFKTGEKVEIYLAPGKYVFVAEGKPNPFSEPPGESEVEIISGQMNKFRLRLVPGDGPRYERTIQP
ncbi:hypothetical protein LJR277_003933 [Pseudomonas sp. LjRoot277]|uniref:hypothetical protein n=1 Tax=Pseudomonas sp. LjRoot277 TaxID=3342307 RepID=UPI003ED0A8C6